MTAQSRCPTCGQSVRKHQIRAGDLAKSFDGSKHPRGHGGRFAAVRRFANDHPNLTGLALGAAAVPAAGVLADAARFVRGKPESGIHPLVRQGAKLFGVPTGLLEDQDKTAVALKWRDGAASQEVRGRAGLGDPISRILAGAGSERHVGTIQALATETPTADRPTHLWRGLNGVGAAQFTSAKPGDTVKLDGPTSWSRERSVATTFSRRNYIRGSLKPGDARVRVHLRDAHKVASFDVDEATLVRDGEAESAVGMGAHVRVDKVRTAKDGTKVILATALGHDAKAAYRRGIVRRLASPSFHTGRALWGSFNALPLVYAATRTTHGWLWGHGSAEKAFDSDHDPKPPALSKAVDTYMLDRGSPHRGMSPHLRGA